MQDYHVHTYHSPDSDVLPGDACEAAINTGLSEIAFTDHMDIDWPSDLFFEIEDPDKYVNEITKVKNKYSGRLSVKLGIEMGLQPHTLNNSIEIIKKYPFDFVIASVHLVNREDPYLPEYYAERDKRKSYEDYYTEVYRLLKLYDRYNVIGHLDYLRRYIPYPYEPEDAYIAQDMVDEILRHLVENGKGLEVNTSGYSHISNNTMPHFNVIKRFKELGGEIITLGSDAHTTDQIGYQWKRGLEMIMEAGFVYLTSFTDMNPEFKPIIL